MSTIKYLSVLHHTSVFYLRITEVESQSHAGLWTDYRRRSVYDDWWNESSFRSLDFFRMICVATTRRWTRCRMVWFTKCKRWPNIAHVHEWCRKQSTTDCYCRHAVSFTDMVGDYRLVTGLWTATTWRQLAPRRRRGRTLGIWFVSRWSNVDNRPTCLSCYKVYFQPGPYKHFTFHQPFMVYTDISYSQKKMFLRCLQWF